jgi:release factor glutamine methyltransferase
MPNSQKPMTIKTWLKATQSQIAEANISSARLDSELILAHVLKCDRSYLLSHSEDALTDEQLHDADALLERRLKYEPMAYILGSREFYGLMFKTDERALIPRGESEVIVQTTLEYLKQTHTPQVIAEVGTGSGAIICAIAHNAPNHTYLATDISPEAIALAQENAHTINVPVTFLTGNLGQPLLAEYRGKINILAINLPYIATELLTQLDPTVRYFEPNIALNGGGDGLDLYRQFMPQAKQLLAPQGLLLCEHEHDQGEAMRELARQYFPDAEITTLKDSLGHDRTLKCKSK